MAYTERQLYDAIVQLAIISHMKWWPWEDKSVKTPEDQKGTSIFWREMTKYCWQAYTKANGSAGMAYIGRMADVKDLKGTLCKIDLEKGQTLFDEGTKGNALEMNKWAPVLNDSWVLGHIHRFADFELYSPRSFQNVWEDSPNRKGMVVTAREITGLETFGYLRETVTGVNVKYICKDHKRRRPRICLPTTVWRRRWRRPVTGPCSSTWAFATTSPRRSKGSIRGRSNRRAGNKKPGYVLRNT
jgi:hypothetical protein